ASVLAHRQRERRNNGLLKSFRLRCDLISSRVQRGNVVIAHAVRGRLDSNLRRGVSDRDLHVGNDGACAVRYGAENRTGCACLSKHRSGRGQQNEQPEGNSQYSHLWSPEKNLRGGRGQGSRLGLRTQKFTRTSRFLMAGNNTHAKGNVSTGTLFLY